MAAIGAKHSRFALLIFFQAILLDYCYSGSQNVLERGDLVTDIVTYKGCRVELKCRADVNEVLNIRWEFDQSTNPGEISEGVGVEDSYISVSKTLYDVKPNASGIYSCIALDSSDNRIDSIDFNVTVGDEMATSSDQCPNHRPSWDREPVSPWQYKPYSTVVSKTSVVYMDCKARNSPVDGVRWTLPDGTQLGTRESSDNIQIFANGTMYIINVKDDNIGQYVCQAGPQVSTTISINYPKLAEVEVKPENSTTILVGCPITISCRGTGDEPLQVKVKAPESRTSNMNYDEQDRISTTATDGIQIQRLFIEKTKLTDSGHYTCTAKNPYGPEVTATAEIRIKPNNANGTENCTNQQDTDFSGENQRADFQIDENSSTSGPFVHSGLFWSSVTIIAVVSSSNIHKLF